jgi:GNAT superfamily N-acetyltransferase
VLKNKDAVPWFIWYTRHKVEGIEFKSLKSNNNEIGVCFFIENNDSIEVGILIHKEYRRHGYGKLFIESLIAERPKRLLFKVSKYNLSSLAFFQKQVNFGLLQMHPIEGQVVFTTKD